MSVSLFHLKLGALAPPSGIVFWTYISDSSFPVLSSLPKSYIPRVGKTHSFINMRSSIPVVLCFETYLSVFKAEILEARGKVSFLKC